MKKRILALGLALISIFQMTGCSLTETVSGLSKDKPYSYSSVDDLESGMAYVWSDEKEEDIRADLEKENDHDIFFRTIRGDYNFKGKETEEKGRSKHKMVTDIPRKEG